MLLCSRVFVSNVMDGNYFPKKLRSCVKYNYGLSVNVVIRIIKANNHYLQLCVRLMLYAAMLTTNDVLLTLVSQNSN